jgi:hypothetical protein
MGEMAHKRCCQLRIPGEDSVGGARGSDIFVPPYQFSVQSARVLGKRAKAGSEGKAMNEGIFWKMLQLSMIVLALYSAGCAGKESIGGFRLGQPSDFWCTVDNRSPFPPYCDPEHW